MVWDIRDGVNTHTHVPPQCCPCTLTVQVLLRGTFRCLERAAQLKIIKKKTTSELSFKTLIEQVCSLVHFKLVIL